MHENTQEITDIILKAAKKALKETSGEPEPEMTQPIQWPVECTIGPGLEGGIACETKIGYVNGSKGWLIYRGYNIFDLCAKSSYEEVSYLLLHGQIEPPKIYSISFKTDQPTDLDSPRGLVNAGNPDRKASQIITNRCPEYMRRLAW